MFHETILRRYCTSILKTMARYNLKQCVWLLVAIFAMLIPLAFLHFLSASFARPLDQSNGNAQEDLPTIKLPYGTWRASKYDAASDV